MYRTLLATYPSKSLGHTRSVLAFFGSGGWLMLLSDTVMVVDI